MRCILRERRIGISFSQPILIRKQREDFLARPEYELLTPIIDAKAIYNSEFFNARMVLFGSSILACAFLGFDAITTVAEETINPEKTITRAIIIICSVAGIIFFIGAYVAQIVWANAWNELTDPDAGVFELLSKINADYMPTLFLIMDNIATVANAIAAQTAVTRVMYAMGRDGMLPKKVFGYIHPKTRTPIYNIIITTLIGLTAIFYADNLLGAASIISFGAAARTDIWRVVG